MDADDCSRAEDIRQRRIFDFATRVGWTSNEPLAGSPGRKTAFSDK